MRRFGRGIRRLTPPLLALFAVLAALGVFLVLGESRRTRILTEYEAERTASRLVESIEEAGFDAAAKLDERILGFGIYGPRGVAITRWGNAPESIRSLTARDVFAYDSSGRRLSLTRPVGMRMMASDAQSLRQQRPQRMGTIGRAASGYLYLSLDVSEYYRRRGLLGWAAIAAPIAAAALAAAFLLLISSNARFRRAAEERETLARLGESARTLAHEIRNPLSAIRIQTGILRQALPDAGAPEKSALDAIDEETERLNALSRRVGDFLRNPAGTPRPIELGAFLRELADKSPHRPRFSPEADGLSVIFDPELLRSSIENLLRNARESYGEAEGEVELCLSATAGKRGRRALIAVRDRGRGLATGSMEKAFDPFYTEKPGGYGIGLPLARGFVEAAGGALALIPREGGGTEARIELPIAEAP